MCGRNWNSQIRFPSNTVRAGSGGPQCSPPPATFDTFLYLSLECRNLLILLDTAHAPLETLAALSNYFLSDFMLWRPTFLLQIVTRLKARPVAHSNLHLPNTDLCRVRDAEGDEDTSTTTPPYLKALGFRPAVCLQLSSSILCNSFRGSRTVSSQRGAAYERLPSADGMSAPLEELLSSPEGRTFLSFTGRSSPLSCPVWMAPLHNPPRGGLQVPTSKGC